MNIRKAPITAVLEFGSIPTGTGFHPYWNLVPSVLELGSIRTGTGFHPYSEVMSA